VRVCLDTNVFIVGLSEPNSAAARLLALLPTLDTIIPRQVARELSRNLTEAQQVLLFGQAAVAGTFRIVDEVPSDALVQAYIARGLPLKGDAIIGAFAEHFKVEVLVSLNRHFLRLETDAFEVLTPEELLERIGAE
jgi:predicted nucleic acid-binding protein